MSQRSLEDLLRSSGNTVELLRNSQAGPNVYPGVPSEYTNWRDEQQAWQQTCVLYNQSYHMADLAVRGPDAQALLSHLAVNSFEGFGVDRAKHFVPCTPDGYVIGDVILFHLAESTFNLVGRAPALNWITYHAETGGYDVEVELDQRWALRTDGRRRSYRFQVQGPNAMQVIEKLLGGPPPELPFFRMTDVTIAGRPARALRHGMAGQPGFELRTRLNATRGGPSGAGSDRARATGWCGGSSLPSWPPSRSPQWPERSASCCRGFGSSLPLRACRSAPHRQASRPRAARPAGPSGRARRRHSHPRRRPNPDRKKTRQLLGISTGLVLRTPSGVQLAAGSAWAGR